MIAQITRNEDRAWSAALAYGIFFEGVTTAAPEKRTIPRFCPDFEPHREARKLLQPAFGAAATASYLGAAMPLFERAIDSWVRRGKVDFKSEIRGLHFARISTRTFLGVEDEQEATMIEKATIDLWGTLLALTKNQWLSFRQRRAIRARERLLTTPSLAHRGASGSRGRGSVQPPVRRDPRRTVRAARRRQRHRALPRHPPGRVRYDREHPGQHGVLPGEEPRVARAPAGRGPRCRPRADLVRGHEAPRGDRPRPGGRRSRLVAPLARGIPRSARCATVQLGRFRIPAGTLVIATTATALRDGRWWTDPERFTIPDRFSDGRAEDRKHKGLFLPFGSGAHACIGMHLSTVEAKAFWHAMLTRCQFRLARDYEARHTLAPLGAVSGDVKLALETV